MTILIYDTAQNEMKIVPDELWVSIIIHSDFSVLCNFRATCHHYLNLIEDQYKTIIIGPNDISNQMQAILSLLLRRKHYLNVKRMYYGKYYEIASLRDFYRMLTECICSNLLCCACMCNLYIRFCAIWVWEWLEYPEGSYTYTAKLYCQDCYIRGMSTFYNKYNRLPCYINVNDSSQLYSLAVLTKDNSTPNIDAIPGLIKELDNVLHH